MNDKFELERISKYNVTLKRLTHDKIELVRQWRNHPKISQYMEIRDEITPEMQEKWFQRINNEYNFYFIIEIDNKEIGLINIRDVDYVKREGEPGIFIWDDDYLNSTASFQASIALLDFAFDTLELQRLIIHVLVNNKRAINYNKAFGFRISANQDGVANQEYTLSPEDYKKNRIKIAKLLR